MPEKRGLHVTFPGLLSSSIYYLLSLLPITIKQNATVRQGSLISIAIVLTSPCKRKVHLRGKHVS
jgi:hypothetical protein